MQIKDRIITVKPESEFDKSLEKELFRYMYELAMVLNKGLLFTDNFNAQIFTVADTGLADTEFSVSHTLKRVPSGYLVVNRDKAGVVYDSGTAWTVTEIYLKCNVASTNIKIIVF
jgi:hypothetical protein